MIGLFCKVEWIILRGKIWISFDPKFFKTAGRTGLDKIWRRFFEGRVDILLKYVIAP